MSQQFDEAVSVGTRQRDMLLAFIAKMEAIDEDLSDDGATNRDHDSLLYGEPS